MVGPSDSPASDRSVLAAALAAIVLFVGSWTLLHVGFYTHTPIIDTPVYQQYGNAIADGKVPYRDFALEYPPGALPMFALPGLAAPGHAQNVSTGFRRTFETLMWICGAVALCAMALVLLGLGIATKFYPGIFVPIGVAFAWKRRGAREALVCLGLAVGVAATIFLPFFVLAPEGVRHSVTIQLGRPLQVESLGSALLLA